MQRYQDADRHRKQIDRIRKQPVINLLASRNILPKYGFPVDVVSLKLQPRSEGAGEPWGLYPDASLPEISVIDGADHTRKRIGEIRDVFARSEVLWATALNEGPGALHGPT